MRTRLNVTVDETVAEEARALRLNMSRVTEAALAEAVKAERNRLWREENRAALEAYADEIAREGLPLSRFRTF